MKKTRKILSLTALLLLAAMLFTACGPVDFAKEDMADYITIGESGYKNLTVTVDKTVLRDTEVMKSITDKLKTAKDKDAISGLIQKYDEVSTQIWVIDDKGNLAQTDLALGTDGKLKPSVLPIGYGEGVNSGILAEIEKKLFDDSDPDAVKQVNIVDHLLKLADSKEVIPDGAFIYLTYLSNSSEGVSGDSKSTTYIINTSMYQSKETQGTNSYDEAISLGLKRLNELENGGVKINTSTAQQIQIVPTAQEIPADKLTSTNPVYINYDLDFDDNDSYDSGLIAATIKNAAYLYEAEGTGTGKDAEPIVVEYTYPSDYTGTYTVNGTSEKLAGKKVSVYVYLTSKTSYEIGELTEDFIKNTEKFASDLTGDALIDAYKAHVREKLEADYVKAAKNDAMTKLWSLAVKSTTVIKQPTRNIKAYVSDVVNNIKYQYYDYYNFYLNSEGKYIYGTAADTGLYDTWKDYAIAIYAAEGYEVKDYDGVLNVINSNAANAVKQMMLTYRLAELLGVELTEEEYKAHLNKDAEEWIKSIAESDKTTAATLTAEDYEEYCGESNLRGTYLLDEVMEKLYETNLSGVSYNELYTDGTEKE